MGKSLPRVCHLTSVHQLDDIRVFVKECRSVAAAGYETHLVIPGVQDGMRDGVRLHGVTRYDSRWQRMTRTVYAVYCKALEINADLYHFHNPEMILAGLLLRTQGKRVIYDIHEDFPQDVLTKEYLGWARRPLALPLKLLENIAGRHFSALVAATANIGARFQSVNPRTVVINNYPLRDELVSPVPTEWERRAHAVAYVGVISPIRGLTHMVEAMECLPGHLQATLELAGKYRLPEYRDQAAQRLGWKYVHDHGVLGRAEVAQLLGRVRAGLVVLHPLSQFVVSQPNKLYEYMSGGIPVVASDFPLWREVVERNQCGLVVDPLDSKAISSVIEFVLTHPAEAEAMGQHGRAAIVAQYNWEMEASRLFRLYDQTLEIQA